MEFDLSWILLGLPLAFVLGWWASRFDLRQLRDEIAQILDRLPEDAQKK